MPRLVLFSLVILGLSCSRSMASGTNEPVEPVRLDSLEVPASLQVLWVGQEMLHFNSGARSFLNVYGKHEHTGEQYLLVYQRTREGSRLVNIVAISATLSDSLLPALGTRDRTADTWSTKPPDSGR
jgi:hypothetical protein